MSDNEQIRLAEARMADMKQTLEFKQRNCSHDWEPPVDCSRYEAGYSYPGDSAGGIDRRTGGYVPGRKIYEWTRTCRKCGKTQKTNDPVRMFRGLEP